MKKLFKFLCAAIVLVILVILFLRGDISKQSFGIEYNGIKVCAGETVSDEKAQTISDDLGGLPYFYAEDGKVIGVYLRKEIPASENAKTLCGVQIGEDAQKVIDVMGKNYEKDIQSYYGVEVPSSYVLTYHFYEDIGRLLGLPPEPDTDNKIADYVRMYETKIYNDKYWIVFHIEDGKVSAVGFYYDDAPPRLSTTS